MMAKVTPALPPPYALVLLMELMNTAAAAPLARRKLELERSLVAIKAFAPLVAFLGLDAQGRDRPRFEFASS